MELAVYIACMLRTLCMWRAASLERQPQLPLDKARSLNPKPLNPKLHFPRAVDQPHPSSCQSCQGAAVAFDPDTGMTYDGPGTWRALHGTIPFVEPCDSEGWPGLQHR